MIFVSHHFNQRITNNNSVYDHYVSMNFLLQTSFDKVTHYSEECAKCVNIIDYHQLL